MYRVSFCMSLFIVFISQSILCAGEASISVSTAMSDTQINKRVFGVNLIAYDPNTYEEWRRPFYGYSDFGAGIWDSNRNVSVDEVVDLAKDVQVSALRFPGGCGVHHYVWKNAIGKNRKHFLYGIHEFLKTCKEVGAEPIITVSFFEGNEIDKADFVEYLNSKDDGNHKWAAIRAQNGHKEPYNVKYFEVGNEDWHGDHKAINKVEPEEYAKRYLKYYEAMKSVDPGISIGAILWTDNWNNKVMNIIKDKIDFAIIHTYPSPGVRKEQLEQMDAKDIYLHSLAIPDVDDDYNFKEILKLLKDKSGKDVPIAVTEYNGGFVQEKPVSYRHCLGTALLNAELLRIFMKPKNNILMANYWQFNNSYWGMISNGFNDNPKDLKNPYYKRPNYYVFEMYHKYFGDILINTDVKCDTYDASVYQPIKSLVKRLKTGTLIKNNLLSGSWEIKAVAGVDAVEKDGVLEVKFLDCFVAKNAPRNDTADDSFRNDKAGRGKCEYNYYHSAKKANVEANMYYKLSGYIRTDNLVDDNGVCLEVQDARGWTQTKSAASTEKVKGTTDWEYVEVIYETLPDAKAVTVLARRVGEKGPLKGKAYFKDVKLEKFIPSLDTKIPYLSVNASKSKDGSKVYLMVINKNMDVPMTATIDLKDFTPVTKGNAWVLNGPAVDATNELKHDNVKVTHREFEIRAQGTEAQEHREEHKSTSAQGASVKEENAGIESVSFEYTFEPHSLTALEIDRG